MPYFPLISNYKCRFCDKQLTHATYTYGSYSSDHAKYVCVNCFAPYHAGIYDDHRLSKFELYYDYVLNEPFLFTVLLESDISIDIYKDYIQIYNWVNYKLYDGSIIQGREFSSICMDIITDPYDPDLEQKLKLWLTFA